MIGPDLARFGLLALWRSVIADTVGALAQGKCSGALVPSPPGPSPKPPAGCAADWVSCKRPTAHHI